MKLIILAGGTGTRLWPMSRKLKPKQFWPLLSDVSMLRETYNRLNKRFPVEDIYVATNEKFVSQIKDILPDCHDNHLIIEPSQRDTGPAMGYAALYLSLQYPEEPMGFIPCDHFIGNVSRFLDMLSAADSVIRQTGKMVDIAVQPNYPSTALGYTKIGDLQETIEGIGFYQFLGHKEKPNYEVAKNYLDDGHYLWHANYYMWTPGKFLESCKKYAPNLYEGLASLKEFIIQKDFLKINEIYENLPKISFDFAVTEKMDPSEVLIMRGDFGWSDIGAWDVLYEQLKSGSDDCQNLIKGNAIAVDSHRCFIAGQKDKMVAVLGMNDLAVIDTEDALLVCPLARSQEVKTVVSKIDDERFL